MSGRRLISLGLLSGALLSASLVGHAHAQIAHVDSELAGRIRATGEYAFRVGDDPAWAQPDYDDETWERRASDGFPPELAKNVGWIRLHVEVDTTLWNVPIGLSAHIHGAAEVYVDGRLMIEIGEVGASPAEERAQYGDFGPYVILFQPPTDTAGGPSPHLVTVR